MTDDHGFLKTQRINRTHHVSAEMKQSVLIDSFRFVGLAITPHVRRDGAVTRIRKSLQLMPPRIPRLRPSVTEQHKGTCAHLRDMHLDAVGRNELVFYFQVRLPRQATKTFDYAINFAMVSGK